MPHYLIRISPTRFEMPDSPTESESETVGQHFRYLMAAKEAGTLFMAGRTLIPPHVGIVVFEAENEIAAQAFLDGDPAVAAGVFEGVVQPFGLAIR